MHRWLDEAGIGPARVPLRILVLERGPVKPWDPAKTEDPGLARFLRSRRPEPIP